MYSAVRTHDYDYPESEMDERESLYFDTISLADSEAAAAAAHRKSLSQSRNTIYHSAVDLAGDETRNSLRNGAIATDHMRLAGWQPGYRQSTALEHLNGDAGAGAGAGGGGGAIGVDHTDAAIAAQLLALQNGRTHLPTGIGVAGGYGYSRIGAGCGRGSDNDHEVSKRLLRQSSTVSNSDKKLPITYSEWKSRTSRLKDARSVDFVLAYKGDDSNTTHQDERVKFEEYLKSEGLVLEPYSGKTVHFTKIHAPMQVLQRYAEVLKIKMPVKEPSIEESQSVPNTCGGLFSWMQLNSKVLTERSQRIHMEFARKYLELYDAEHPNYFDASTRYSIINSIMQQKDIEKLIEDGVYLCAYPLHDNDKRDVLLKEWASLRNWKKMQPLDHIKDYFGAKVALYYAWLGFYTQMLIPISVLGIIFFLYGFVTWNSDPISYDICNGNETIMCPQCDRGCKFWYLNETCTSSRFNYLIDNEMTMVFAFMLAIWAVAYLELWKRYSAGLVHRWGLTGFNHHVEHPRPQYLAKVLKSDKLKDRMVDPKHDPDVPFWSFKFLPKFTSYSIVVLFICISLIGVASIIIYRMAQRASSSIIGNENSMTYKIMVLPITAGFLDLILISALDLAYSKLAIRLTNYENCRTQTEYDESLTIKNYAFQFVNYYSSLFYIAFLKGKFVGYPSKYNRIFNFRQEECNPGGCLMELCMQLVIIMVGKQAVNAIIEMLIPYLIRVFNVFKQHNKDNNQTTESNQLNVDYNLLPAENNSLYEEYLEMVVQYGFITLFSLAFPLAPLLALINNVIEVRLDAIKMLRFIRRPVGMRARNIGVWQNIMAVVTHISVASSAMIIAFSSNFIPKLVYKATHDDPDLNGYLNFTLAAFYTKDYKTQSLLDVSRAANVTLCHYIEFRNDPWENAPYKRPMIYWQILMARLAFIVIYQNIISMLQGILRWAVPDVSARLLKRIKIENMLLRDKIIDYEKQQAQAQTHQEQLQQQQLQQLQQLQQQQLRLRLNGNSDTATTFV
ncbi:hypothetical protein AWZ03_012750 [Drosophila navojoa]|uniref:Anoctamin n=1 Tax=Drosophila navojoa TaxID=7232 RepID=A0A484AW40_DRONA|nr:anoctamin-1 [Drosophila navojoa]TDG40819.1 hypothetical protein AWZ03_012750 [Drosophila navojoa]